MPNDNVLTAEARATIMDACQSISRGADGLKAGCAIGDEWPDAEDKAFYDAELRLLARLVALLNDSGQSEPETATVARIEQLRKALFESRDAMRVMSNWVKKSDPAGHSWAVRMVDRANAALNGEPEPRSEVTDDDKLCAERYRWLRERAWYVDAATYALELRERWRSGNEPLPDVDEVECALDAARTGASS
ncbi:gp39 [Burkholderia pseudomallei]|nr:gp39 [Burkholderia pseudomallei]